MLGSSVMIPGNYARIDSDQTIHGMLDLPKASAQTEIRLLMQQEIFYTANNLAHKRQVLLVSVGKIYLQKLWMQMSH